MAKKVQLQTNGKEWQVIDGEQVLVDVEKQDIDPITSSSCVQIEGFRTLEEAVSDNKMLSQDLTYTKVMDKVGGDYHQNVLDGQYSKAILYGNTQVNLCEEDTSNALHISTTFTSFNNGELQIKNKESQVVAPLIKGVTMVNLAQINSSPITSGNGLPIRNVKGNTLYTLSFKFTTKNTNSGIVIQSYDANGTYLENTMHKTGLGDVVKFTFTTHANATKIHICNNAAYGGETIQLDEIMLIEGDQTALDIPYFKGMRSVELSKPLTNLFTDDLTMYAHNTTVTNSGGTVTVTSTAISQWASVIYYLDLKPNTKYVIMWDGLTFTQTSGGIDYIISVCENDTIFSHMGNKFTTLRSIIFDTGDKSAINIRIHATLSNTETGTTTVTGLRVFEYDDYLRSVDLQSIGWFSGTKNVAVEPVKTCSKNLYPYGDVSFTSSGSNWYDAKGNNNMYGDIASKSKSRFLLKKGTYTLSIGSTQNIEQYGLVDDKETTYGNTFTLSQDTYMTLRFKRIQEGTLTTATNIQIERGETATDYVAHDSRYYEPDGQNAIVLRSLPDGVCDTFNLQTGEYIQRIGEAVLDGDEDIVKGIDDTDYVNTIEFYINRVVNVSSNKNSICDSYIYKYKNEDTEHFYTDNKRVVVFIQKTKLSSQDVDGFKQYLQQNPITVQYQLATPIKTIIPRTIKRNNNGTVSTVDFKTYTNKESLVLPKNPSYLTINSMTSIKPVVEPITYIDFKTRLKANTDYSVIMDKDSANKTINLGGTSKTYSDKMLVRTPSVDLEQNLRISGSGSIQNIMVIEGEVLDKELPYFNGMCNVKMPIVRNCGKNLIGDKIINEDDYVMFKLNKLKPNQQYIISTNYNIAQGRIYLVGKEKEFVIQDWGENKKVFKAPYDIYDYTKIRFWKTGLKYDKTSMYFQLEESNEGITPTSYEPYRGNDICLVQGEIGLSQDMFEQGGMHYPLNSGRYLPFEDCKADSTTRIRTKECIPLKPGVAYRISCVGATVQIYFYDASKKSIEFDCGNTDGLTFTTPNGASYMSLMFKNDSKLSVTDFMNKNTLQILELDSTVQLRSLPNGVKDEINLLTGEYIQRVGEIVLDGSEDWVASDVVSKRYSLDLYATMNAVIDKTKILCICDKIQSITTNQSDNDKMLGITITNGNRVMINTNYDTINEFKNWLSQNPITVQYELAKPIISYPRIVSNTQEREVGVKLPNGICDTYNPSTGITTVRVGKVVLDGSENWILFEDATITSGLKYFRMPNPSMKPYDIQSYCNWVLSDSLPTVPYDDIYIHGTSKKAAISGVQSFGLGGIGALYIYYSEITTVEQLKTWLSQNPVTVWYELKYPQIQPDIVLPNGVHDDYNPITGLYTKRVMCVEFDGSDDEDWHEPFVVAANGAVDMYGTWTEQPLNNAKLAPSTDERIPGICDKLKFRNSSLDSANEEFYFISYTGRFNMNVNRSKLSEPSEQSLKTYLSQNPIKVWYELSTPITYQLTPYFGLPMPYAYKDGYLIMDSAYDGQTLPPEITYQLTVNRTGQITQNNIKLKEHTARLSNLEYILIEATLDSIFDREMQNFELELMNIELLDLDE